jgi:hypothetical protein
LSLADRRAGLLLHDLSGPFTPYVRRPVRLQLDPRLAHLRETAETLRLSHVLRGLARAERILGTQGVAPSSFAMIGPGSGAEAIGAAHIFKALHRLVLSDRDASILDAAADNVRGHVDASLDVIAQAGDVHAPPVMTDRPVNLLYANFADVPFTEAREAVVDRYAFCLPVARTAHDAVLNDAQLGLAYAFLRSLPATLTARGAAIILLGGRFPLEVFDRLGEAAGLRFQELHSWLQPQADARHVLRGFAATETGAGFDFYDLAAAETHLSGRKLQGADLKAALAPCRLSAGAALSAFRAGRRIGHTAHLLLATPIGRASVH